MKTSLKAALLVSISVTALGKAKGSETTYDRFRDQTRVETHFGMNDELLSPVQHTVSASYVCPGTATACKLKFVEIKVHVRARKQFVGGWVYDRAHNLLFLADGKRISPVAEPTWDGELGSRPSLLKDGSPPEELFSHETVTATFAVDDFLKLANGHMVEMELGDKVKRPLDSLSLANLKGLAYKLLGQ